jgi:5'-nucleotidase
MRLTILVSNDDGIDAPGLLALEEALAPLGDVWTVAPASEQSAKSHALTMHDPLRAERRGERRWAVAGTPADCAYLGLLHLVPTRPDIVVSGINAGSNLGADIWYSGTVAAAREGCLHGIPAVAVSQHRPIGPDGPHWDTAGAVAVRVVEAMLAEPTPPWTYLNVNVPDVPLAALRGLAACPLGRRTYAHQVDAREDPRGRMYFWIGGPHATFEGDHTDGRSVEQGWATVTPLDAYPADEVGLARVRRWTDR